MMVLLFVWKIVHDVVVVDLSFGVLLSGMFSCILPDLLRCGIETMKLCDCCFVGAPGAVVCGSLACLFIFFSLLFKLFSLLQLYWHYALVVVDAVAVHSRRGKIF